MHRTVPGDRSLAKAFGRNWKENNPSKDIRMVDFQMENINMEVGFIVTNHFLPKPGTDKTWLYYWFGSRKIQSHHIQTTMRGEMQRKTREEAKEETREETIQEMRGGNERRKERKNERENKRRNEFKIKDVIKIRGLSLTNLTN